MFTDSGQARSFVGGMGAPRTSRGGRESDSRIVVEEMEVTVTTERWKEIEEDYEEEVGWCFCSLTTWQSSLD